MSKGKARVLIIDDEIEIVRVLQRGLIVGGYTVLTATSGEKALELVEQHRPDILLLDLGGNPLAQPGQERIGSNWITHGRFTSNAGMTWISPSRPGCWRSTWFMTAWASIWLGA